MSLARDPESGARGPQSVEYPAHPPCLSSQPHHTFLFFAHLAILPHTKADDNVPADAEPEAEVAATVEAAAFEEATDPFDMEMDEGSMAREALKAEVSEGLSGSAPDRLFFFSRPPLSPTCQGLFSPHVTDGIRHNRKESNESPW